MTTVAVVLAGGRGTRSADPSVAKLAQTIGEDSLMAWHLRLLEGTEIMQVLVVAGHLGEQVQQLCDSITHEALTVTVVHEEKQKGTVAALRLAAAHTDADEFLVILGDILMSFRVDAFLADWRRSGKQVAVIVHPSGHPEDSDAAFTSHDGSVRVVPKSEERPHIPNMSSTGLFAITREGLKTYGDQRDFGSSVLPKAAAQHDLLAYVSSHYFKDTGTTDRLATARSDHDRQAFARRGTTTRRPGLFLDRDGVINPVQPETYTPGDYTLLPGVAAAIREANRHGIPVIVITNQPGVAKGLMTFGTHEAIRARMDRLLGEQGAFVDDYVFCPHHPDGGFEGEVEALKRACDCRKPASAMAHAAAAQHHLDLDRSVMVGDTARDQGLAEASGMAFIHVGAPCTLAAVHECHAESAKAIEQAIGILDTVEAGAC
jgi:mannose-1-phosphate guanylyltransferase/phosphomannomutase